MRYNDYVGPILGVLCSVLIICGAFYWRSVQCHAQWKDYGETKFSITTGCMVHYKGKWTPYTAIREF